MANWCQRCSAPVLKAFTAGGKPIELNTKASPFGTHLHVIGDRRQGQLVVRRVSPNEKHPPRCVLYFAHRDFCGAAR